MSEVVLFRSEAVAMDAFLAGVVTGAGNSEPLGLSLSVISDLVDPPMLPFGVGFLLTPKPGLAGRAPALDLSAPKTLVD